MNGSYSAVIELGDVILLGFHACVQGRQAFLFSFGRDKA